jgi:hypothetical protein
MKTIWKRWTDFYLQNQEKRNQLDESFNPKRLIFSTILSSGQLTAWFFLFVYIVEAYYDLPFMVFSSMFFFCLIILNYRSLIENDMAQKNDRQYVKWVLIHIDIVKVLSVLSISNFILFTYHLNRLVPIWMMVTLLLFATATTLYILFFEDAVKMQKKSFFRLLLSGIFFSIIYRILFLLVGTSSVHLAYYFSSILLFILYGIKTIWLTFDFEYMKYNVFVSLFLIIIFLPFYFRFDETILNFQGDLIYNEINLSSDLLQDREIDDIFSYNGRLFIQEESRLYEYDTDQLIQIYEPNVDVELFLIVDDQVKAIVLDPVVSQNLPEGVYQYDLYAVSGNTSTFERSFTHGIFVSNKTLQINGETVLVDIVKETNRATFYNLEGEILTPTGIENNSIFIEENDYIVTYKDGEFYYYASNVKNLSNLYKASYNNGVFIHQKLGYFYVQNEEQYFNSQDGKQLPFYDRRIISFTYQNGIYYFFLRSFTNEYEPYELVVVDKNMRILHEVGLPQDTILFDDYFITEDVLLNPMLININQPVLYFISEDAEFMNDALLLFWLFILFTLPFRVPTISSTKRIGGKYANIS